MMTRMMRMRRRMITTREMVRMMDLVMASMISMEEGTTCMLSRGSRESRLRRGRS
jgi:hypothetical protein